MFEPQSQKFSHVPVVQGVVEYLAFSAGLDEGLFAHSPELVRYGRLAESQVGGQIADAHLPPGKGHEDLQTGRVPKHLEGQCQALQLRFRDGLGSGTVYAVQVNDTDSATVLLQQHGFVSHGSWAFIYMNIYSNIRRTETFVKRNTG
jgi:hypothetical protein